MSRHRDRVRYLRKAVQLVWNSARSWTILQTLVIVVQGLLPVATLMLTRQVVDAAGRFLGQASGARDLRDLLILAPWVVAVVLTGWICRAISSIAMDAQSAVVSDHVQDALQQKSIEVDLAYYETSSYHDQMRLAQSEAMSRPTSIVRNLVQLGSGSVVLGSVVGVLWISQGLLLPILLAAALPGTFSRIWNSRRWHQWRMAQSVSERYAGYLHLLLTALPFAKEIRLSGNGNELRRQHRELRDRLRRSRLALTWRRAGIELAADALSMTAMAAGLGLVYLRMKGNAMTLGDLALLYGGFQKGKSAFSGVLGSLASLYEDSLFISHYYDFLGLPQRVRSPEHPTPMPSRIEQGIRLEHVRFRYPGMDRDVLSDINLTLRAGEHVALVGENGSGKTTLVKLLCRLYDPTEGRILIDGTDIREFSLEALRASFSALFQDFVRYQMTAGENVRMGDVAIPAGDPRIAAAARQAGAARMIEQLPRGLDTRLGRLFEGGSELSEGQWQRVALARAFVKTAPFVMLDEPTSALDAKAERQLLDSVVTLFEGKTSIVVSHRFSTVQAADRILVLSEGQIAESGTHAQLVQANGVYAGLFALHSRGECASHG